MSNNIHLKSELILKLFMCVGLLMCGKKLNVRDQIKNLKKNIYILNF